MCYSYFQFKTIQIDSSAAYAFQPSDVLKVYIFQDITCINFVYRAQSSFHYSAGSSENNTCSGRFAHRMVKFAVGQQMKADIGPFDKRCQFTGRDRIIYIGITVDFEFLPIAFILFGQARHDGYHHQFFAWNTHFFCPISFGDRTEHLLRRTGGRRDVEQIGEVVFKEVYPCRTA